MGLIETFVTVLYTKKTLPIINWWLAFSRMSLLFLNMCEQMCTTLYQHFFDLICILLLFLYCDYDLINFYRFFTVWSFTGHIKSHYVLLSLQLNFNLSFRNMVCTKFAKPKNLEWFFITAVLFPRLEIQNKPKLFILIPSYIP